MDIKKYLPVAVIFLLAFFISFSIFWKENDSASGYFGAKGKIINGEITSDEIGGILSKEYPGLSGSYKLDFTEEYQIYLPKGYNRSNSYPLLMDYSIGIGQWGRYADKYGFIVLYGDISVFAMAALRERMVEEYPVDETKVYLAGFSSGAFNSMYVLGARPDKFRGAILASGGKVENSGDDRRYAGKRFFITLGENDYHENIESARKLKDFLEKNGAIIKFELQPKLGHEYPLRKTDEMIKFILARQS